MADINLKAEEVEQHSTGQELARVTVRREDGKKAIFFVVARIKNGRPVMELVAKKESGDEVQKSVTGFWMSL